MNDKTTINAWCAYDWANSAYMLTITSAIFPIYYNASTRSAFNGDTIPFMGLEISNTVLYSYALSFSFLVIVLISPILSGIADYGNLRKPLMKTFTYLGAFSCMGLFFFEGHNINYGITLSILASIGYAGSLVFYNAYLPEICSRDMIDKVSAKGYSWGYIGGVIQLTLSLIVVLSPKTFGITNDSLPAQISFLSVGLWWIIFSQYSFRKLPENNHSVEPQKASTLLKGYQNIHRVWQEIKAKPYIKKYLTAFFCYNMGVQTIMLLAATFGEKTLSLSTGELIGTILAIQFIAVPGSYLFANISRRKSNTYSIIIMLFLWIIVCINAYFVNSAIQFFMLASLVGLIMGGIQSLSRATYSKLIPNENSNNTSYFSFYEITEKLSIVGGTFSFGFIESLTGNMRHSTLLLMFYFIVGIILMFRFKRNARAHQV
ncbi:MFS transporter [Aureibacter tunicatorum]|uniref:UMF1 family MFS transporter n=1 Tax=Aureibacter tunicatorum TaxID=866807 RepID=A0AAE3XQY2_9BACT|nr:MFS transporter [Aureibacter tunicatorum]MDR6240374.1 UMF1 family MFS transporter [Aureibacter tunicatorum]BDD05745.1 MFS transporter [Aureibacter tunicatorum]